MAYWQGLVTGAALVRMAVAVAAASRPARMATLDVERINIREPDGTLRMVISGRERFPGSFHKGKEIARPDRRFPAGMLFLNDEGTENGGLIWAGKAVDGRPEAGASLTFDRYENDQTLQLLQTDSGENDMAAVVISDRPDGSMFEMVEGKPVARPGAASGPPRLFLGKSRDRASMLMLQDGAGIPRIVLRVERDGTSAIDFLDAEGKVVRTVGPEG